MGLLVAVSAGAQERPVMRGNDGRGGSMTVRVNPGGRWYASSYGAHWRLDSAGRPFAMVSRSYGGGYQSYGSSDWSSDSEEGAMPQYYSLSPVRYQRSSRGYIILPPNFAAGQSDDEPETDGR
jgi:hypothetical protein